MVAIIPEIVIFLMGAAAGKGAEKAYHKWIEPHTNPEKAANRAEATALFLRKEADRKAKEKAKAEADKAAKAAKPAPVPASA